MHRAGNTHLSSVVVYGDSQKFVALKMHTSQMAPLILATLLGTTHAMMLPRNFTAELLGYMDSGLGPAERNNAPVNVNGDRKENNDSSPGQKEQQHESAKAHDNNHSQTDGASEYVLGNNDRTKDSMLGETSRTDFQQNITMDNDTGDSLSGLSNDVRGLLANGGTIHQKLTGAATGRIVKTNANGEVVHFEESVKGQSEEKVVEDNHN